VQDIKVFRFLKLFNLKNLSTMKNSEALKKTLETIKNLPNQQKHLDAIHWLLKRIKEAEKG